MTALFEVRSAAVTAFPGQMDGFPIAPVPCHPAGGINMGGVGQDGMRWDGMLVPPLPCCSPQTLPRPLL